MAKLSDLDRIANKEGAIYSKKLKTKNYVNVNSFLKEYQISFIDQKIMKTIYETFGFKFTSTRTEIVKIQTIYA